MEQPSDLPEAKRALIEKYLRGDRPRTEAATGTETITVSAGAGEQAAGIVPIRTGGTKAPFFFLHGQWKMGGFFCYPMALALGPDRPFYAVDPYEFTEQAAPPRLGAVAAEHVRSIRKIAPQGPYALGGWCNGALLAHMIASQLQSEGQEVERLVLMDPVYLEYPSRLTRIRAMIMRFGGLFGADGARQLELYLSLRQVYRYGAHVASYLTSRDYRTTEKFTGFEREDYPGIYDWAAMGNGAVGRYAGKITFLWSVTQPFRQGWRSIEASEREDHVLPCRHSTCLNEHLDLLVDVLQDSLAR